MVNKAHHALSSFANYIYFIIAALIGAIST